VVEPVLRATSRSAGRRRGKQAVASLVNQWLTLDKLQNRLRANTVRNTPVKKNREPRRNKAQHQLRESFRPLLHCVCIEGLKQLDKTVRHHEKQGATRQKDGKRAPTDRRPGAQRPHWKNCAQRVQERRNLLPAHPLVQQPIPQGGIRGRDRAWCKLAGPADLKDQEYSLNPGRYVGW